MSPVDATAFSLERIRRGEDTISVTGNVLRDYLTDLFPILELGTSAKMLSVVPLINGGGLFETGAGGSAPKHVQQLRQGELPALGQPGRVPRARGQLRAPGAEDGQRARPGPRRHPRPCHRHLPQREQVASRKLGGIDNRGSHFYLALYWAQELAAQTEDAQLAQAFAALAKTLAEQEQTIVAELLAVQGSPADIGGYYQPDPAKAAGVMRPSKTLNEALATLS